LFLPSVGSVYLRACCRLRLGFRETFLWVKVSSLGKTAYQGRLPWLYFEYVEKETDRMEEHYNMLNQRICYQFLISVTRERDAPLCRNDHSRDPYIMIISGILAFGFLDCLLQADIFASS
jgi:hypothetical protein